MPTESPLADLSFEFKHFYDCPCRRMRRKYREWRRTFRRRQLAGCPQRRGS